MTNKEWVKIMKARFEGIFRVQPNYLFINEKKKVTTIVLWHGRKKLLSVIKMTSLIGKSDLL